MLRKTKLTSIEFSDYAIIWWDQLVLNMRRNRVSNRNVEGDENRDEETVCSKLFLIHKFLNFMVWIVSIGIKECEWRMLFQAILDPQVSQFHGVDCITSTSTFVVFLSANPIS